LVHDPTSEITPARDSFRRSATGVPRLASLSSCGHQRRNILRPHEIGQRIAAAAAFARARAIVGGGQRGVGRGQRAIWVMRVSISSAAG